eukprot:11226309-Lingulodinium_polyedra.AAC.1
MPRLDARMKRICYWTDALIFSTFCAARPGWPTNPRLRRRRWHNGRARGHPAGDRAAQRGR